MRECKIKTITLNKVMTVKKNSRVETFQISIKKPSIQNREQLEGHS